MLDTPEPCCASSTCRCVAGFRVKGQVRLVAVFWQNLTPVAFMAQGSASLFDSHTKAQIDHMHVKSI